MQDLRANETDPIGAIVLHGPFPGVLGGTVQALTAEQNPPEGYPVEITVEDGMFVVRTVRSPAGSDFPPDLVSEYAVEQVALVLPVIDAVVGPQPCQACGNCRYRDCAVVDVEGRCWCSERSIFTDVDDGCDCDEFLAPARTW